MKVVEVFSKEDVRVSYQMVGEDYFIVEKQSGRSNQERGRCFIAELDNELNSDYKKMIFYKDGRKELNY